MNRLALAVGVVVGLACGVTPKQPELLSRELPNNPVKPIVAEPQTPHQFDGGGGFVDAGCCELPFALRALEGEQSARLMFPSDEYAMLLDDAGVWRVNACVNPRADVFYFKVGLLTDDQSGILEVDRVNPTLPTDSTSSVAPLVNVFVGADGGVCASIDGAWYSTLPDAGI